MCIQQYEYINCAIQQSNEWATATQNTGKSQQYNGEKKVSPKRFKNIWNKHINPAMLTKLKALRCSSYNGIHPFKVYNSMVFSTFRRV